MNKDSEDRMGDEAFCEELDRAMQEYFQIEKALEEQALKAATPAVEATAKMLNHFVWLLWK